MCFACTGCYTSANRSDIGIEYADVLADKIKQLLCITDFDNKSRNMTLLQLVELLHWYLGWTKRSRQ